jgi:hypothetical protein
VLVSVNVRMRHNKSASLTTAAVYYEVGGTQIKLQHRAVGGQDASLTLASGMSQNSRHYTANVRASFVPTASDIRGR